MRFHFQSEQWLPYPVEQVFRFFSNPENLPRLMPSWQAARIDSAALTPVPDLPHAAGPGSRITLSFRPVPLSPIRLTWLAEIDHFIRNDRFCDTQLHGPFAYWHHCHSVQPSPRGATPGTLLRDQLEYEPPFGLLGRIAQPLVIRHQIRSIFAYRHRRTEELLQTQP